MVGDSTANFSSEKNAVELYHPWKPAVLGVIDDHTGIMVVMNRRLGSRRTAGYWFSDINSFEYLEKIGRFHRFRIQGNFVRSVYPVK